jgi:YVTN family beta-propeller protein
LKKRIAVIGLLLILSACKESIIDIPVPEEGSSSIFVSHLKEPAVSTVNIEDGHIEMKTITFSLSSIAEIKHNQLIAVAKTQPDLYKINFNTEQISPLFKVGEGLVDIAYNPENNLLYACNAEQNKVQIVDMEKKKVIKELPVGEYPVKLQLDDGLLFVLTSGSGEVYVIDTKNQEVQSSFQVSPRPEGLFFDGNYLWVGGHGASGELNDKIYAYDPKTGHEVASVKTGLMPVHFYQDEKNSLLYVLNHGDHSLVSVNTETMKVEEKVFAGDNPSYMVGDKNYIYISSLDGDEIIQVNKENMKITKSFSVSSGPYLLYKGGRGDE